MSAWLLWAGLAWAGETRRFALVVGSNDGGPERVQLRYAGSDARAVADVLVDLGGVAPGDLIVLEEPGAVGIAAAFSTLSARMVAARGQADRVEVFVYYSGHADEAGMLPGGEPYGWGRLRTELARLDADVAVSILDACASGAAMRSKGGSFEAPFLSDQGITVHGSAWLTSSTADEASQESDRIGGSYFTHHLVTALRGAGDVDGDGVVTLSEAYAYTFRETRQSTEASRLGPQSPAFALELAGEGDVVLTDLREATARLVLDAAIGGEVWVRSVDGGSLLEIDKVPGRELSLSVPPGAWKVTVQSRPVAWTASVVVRPDGTTRLLASELEPMTLAMDESARGGEARTVTADFQAVGLNRGPKAATAVRGAGFHLLDGVQRDLDGVTLSLFGTRVREDLRGAQLTPGYAAVGGDARGFQGTGGVGLIGGHLDGVQGSGLVSVVRGRSPEASYGVQWATLATVSGGPLRGVQASALLTVARSHVAGAQLAGGVAVASGGVDGAQIAGLASVARGNVRGVQWSSGYNGALGLRGAQVGLINRVDHGAGAQLGLVNVARELRGVQVGLINVSDRLDGESIGLVTIARDGYHSFEVWTDDLAPVSTGFKFGSRHLYTVVGVGVDPIDGVALSVGAGLGVHAPFFDRRMFFDADVMVRTAETAPGGTVDGVVGSVRAVIGGDVAGPFGLYLGPALHVTVPLGDEVATQSLMPSFRIGGFAGTVGYQAGMRIRF